MSEEEFARQLQDLCETYGIREFAIYGRFAQTVNAKGKLLPASRYVRLDGEVTVAEEAAYYLDRLARQLPH